MMPLTVDMIGFISEVVVYISPELNLKVDVLKDMLMLTANFQCIFSHDDVVTVFFSFSVY